MSAFDKPHPIVQEIRETSPVGRAALICTMRNEGPFILEWVSHHLALGFTDLVIAYNNCTDGSEALLMVLNRLGIIDLVDNNRWRGSPQSAAYRKCLLAPAVRGADWVGVIDGDELVNIHAGAGRWPDLLAAMPEHSDVISLNWRLYGHSGRTDFEDIPQGQRFNRCGPAFAFEKQTGIKSFWRNAFDGVVLGPHRPRFGEAHPFGLNARWFDGSGQPVPDGLRVTGWRNNNGGYDLAQINHYAVRDRDTFLAKMFRGRASNNINQIDARYWRNMNLGSVEDTSVLKTEAERQRILQALLAHPRLRKHHKACVERHRAIIAELKATQDVENLFAQMDAAGYGDQALFAV